MKKGYYIINRHATKQIYQCLTLKYLNNQLNEKLQVFNNYLARRNQVITHVFHIKI